MSTRRSKRIKNLEDAVQSIFSEDEGDLDTVMHVGHQKSESSSNVKRVIDASPPRSSQYILQDLFQTPRRSCRKSVKPAQDYEDIVNKSLRTGTRSPTMITANENEETKEEPPKWTPAKVGRVSHKRGRKSRRTGKGKNENKQKANQAAKSYEKIEGNEVLKHSEELVEEKTDQNKKDKMEEGDDIRLSVENKNAEHISDITLENHHNIEDLHAKTEVNSKEAKNIFEEKESVCGENDVLKEQTESFVLIQEDSEDSEDFTEKSEQLPICIVYEDNISNSAIKDVSKANLRSPKITTQGENEGDSFGSYLKSRDINLFDLGLNPIKDEEEEKDLVKAADNQIKPSLGEAEEMPSLIICEDDNVEIKSSDKLNETFDANDSEQICLNPEESNLKYTEQFMEKLQLSEDDSQTPKKNHKGILTAIELQNDPIVCTPKGSTINLVAPSTPKALLTPKSNSAHKQLTKPTRFPTPYVNKKSSRFNTEGNDSITKKNTSIITLTTSDPKEIVLRGIRKRSFSLCIEGNQQKGQKVSTKNLGKVKQDRMVSFYSPANQTAIIDDLDIKIAKSLKKEKPLEKNSSNKFVTTRRKRSVSFDESIISTSLLPRPVVNISSKSQASSSMSKPPSRTKLPNFAAIHQKQFKKMENLVDHVNRKQERSKNLINSVTKLKPVSAQKTVSLNKNTKNISKEKVKAVEKIGIGNIAKINKSLFNSTTTVATGNTTLEASEITKVITLPNPQLCQAKNRKPPQQQPTKKYLKSSQTINIEKARLNAKTIAPTKPTFNLSTSVISKPTTSSSNFVAKADTSHMSSDKMSSRLQRHMDLYKGRNTSTRAGVQSHKNEVILKGVRSNRRFELQMQHRKNLE